MFERAKDKMVGEEGHNNTFPYLDNIIIAEIDQEDHDTNVQRFLEAVQKGNLTQPEQDGRIRNFYQYSGILHL